MAYFDNAATTYPKPECVYSFMDDFYRNHGGSAGRGDYALANSANILSRNLKPIYDSAHLQGYSFWKLPEIV